MIRCVSADPEISCALWGTCKMRTCGRADRQRVKRGPKFADRKCGRRRRRRECTGAG